MKVFSIVESPIPGDPLAPLRMQETAVPKADWRDLLHYHLQQNILPVEPASAQFHDDNEDRMAGLSDGFLADMKSEVDSIFSNMPAGTQVYYVNSPEELADLLDKFNLG